MGTKANAKKFLLSKGINKVLVGKRHVRLGNAKTQDVLLAAFKLGYLK